MRNRFEEFQSDRYIQLLFRQLPGVVWTTDADLRLTYVAGRLTDNMAPRAKPGMYLHEVIRTPEARERVVSSHLAALRGEPQSFEYSFRDRWFAVNIEQLVGESGHVAGCIAAAFDITEPRRTQERLARSEALLAQAQSVAHIGSFEWDMSSNVITCSEELQRIYGLVPGECERGYEALLDHVHPDDLDYTKSAIFDASRKASPFVYEHRVIRPGGEVRILQTRGDILPGKNGQTGRMLACCWDVTQLRRTMDNLKRARSLLHAALDATADGLFVVDMNGAVPLFNQRFLSLWRLPPELAMQRNRDSIFSYIKDQLKDPVQFEACTLELYRNPTRESFDVLWFKDGRVFERYSGPQRLGNQVVGRVWSFRDVTERETLLQRALFLADATRLLSCLDIEPALDSVARLAVPFMGDACIIDLLVNGEPRRVSCIERDGAAAFNTGLHSAVVSGKSLIYAARTRSCMAAPILVKDRVAGAMTFIGPPMRRYTTADLQFAETVAGRTALAVENSDLYAEAQDALRARDEFLTIAAHEIRSPITAIHLAVQALKTGEGCSSNMAQLLEILEREDRRLARFVDELSGVGTIRSGRLSFNYELVDLGNVVRAAAIELAPERAASGSPLSISTAGDLVGRWDAHALNQVATNLLSNAIKFGEAKPIEVTIRGESGRSRLEIRDHGIGMSQEVISRIFEPFERGVSVRNYGGLGLGLYIARSIVEGMGGTVNVQSSPNKGAIFTVELPNTRNDNE